MVRSSDEPAVRIHHKVRHGFLRDAEVPDQVLADAFRYRLPEVRDLDPVLKAECSLKAVVFVEPHVVDDSHIVFACPSQDSTCSLDLLRDELLVVLIAVVDFECQVVHLDVVLAVFEERSDDDGEHVSQVTQIYEGGLLSSSLTALRAPGLNWKMLLE